ncbi:antibiotic biosynthesis monooxygenase [Anaerocolumna sedimenticola]|uniref:Antibiotic biosynthesis monooxygenase n=1 Tax=Anaerocolumna sedimenticola TaxID=2696063 RepID=A0A6P1TSZ9_9FIRM|nr:putative quinol monooxygenase [Anaerocolumna sedimenticola]QHQ63507.1 antibiotic biosynthesis monooxygenase [Anaerocolumna sedimenticola]
MIKIVAKNYVKADKVNDYIELAKKLVKATNDKDAGCLHYQLYQDATDPQVLTFLEEWESDEHLKQHMEAEHFKEMVPALSEFQEKPGELNIYQVVK